MPEQNYGNHARYVVVRNAVHSESFSLYDESEVRDRVMNQFHGCEIATALLALATGILLGKFLL